MLAVLNRMGWLMLAMLASGCSASETLSVPEKQLFLEEVECWFDIPRSRLEVRCHYMHVPQDHANTSAQWIYFPVIKVSDRRENAVKSPILHLGGGGPGNPMGFWPGADTGWIFDRYRGLVSATGRDMYIIDPRGVGYTEPALACYEYVDMIEGVLPENVSIQEENRLTTEAYRRCRSRLEGQGVDFSRYNSATVSRDMEALRKLLGIEKWNLYGVSYGSRYAMVMARDFPDSVESMILDAATFPDINYTERAGHDFLQSFERLFRFCENDSDCNNRMGDIRPRFWALVERLEENPPRFVIPHPYTGEDMRVALTGIRFLNAYFNALYDAEFYPQLPEYVASLEQGELGQFEIVLILWIYFIMDRDYGDGAAIAHYCHEEAPFVDLDRTIANLALLPELIREVAIVEVQATLRQCREWGITPATRIENLPITTDIPTLFLHGALDPVLPVEDLERQMKTFLNSDSVVFDDISHTVVGLHPCGTEIASKFYDHKLAFRDNVSCDL